MALGDKLPPAGQAPVDLNAERRDAGLPEYSDPDDGEYELEGDDDQPASNLTVMAALRNARADMPKIQKKDRFDGGNAGKFNFRGVDRVVNATRPVLNRHGLVIFPEVLDCQRRDVQRAGGGRSTETVLRVAWHVFGPAGDELKAPLVVYGEALDTSDKSMAKALSVSQREMLVKLLHIATGDPDPDSMMIERGDEDVDRGQVVVYEPNAYRDEALRKDTSVARLNQMINDLRRLNRGAELVENENGDEEKLGSMLVRLRRERTSG